MRRSLRTILVLLLVILGSMRAVGVAREALGLGQLGPDAEAFDIAPNAIDLAAYTTPGTSRLARRLLGLSYPLLLSVFFAEALWYLVVLWQLGAFAAWPYAVAAPTSLLALWAAIRLAAFWFARLKRPLHGPMQTNR